MTSSSTIVSLVSDTRIYCAKMKTLCVFFVIAVAAAYGGLIGAPIATSIVASRQLALGPTAVASPIALGTPLLTRSVIAGPTLAGPAIAAPIGLGGIGWGGSLLGKEIWG